MNNLVHPFILPLVILPKVSSRFNAANEHRLHTTFTWIYLTQRNCAFYIAENIGLDSDRHVWRSH